MSASEPGRSGGRRRGGRQVGAFALSAEERQQLRGLRCAPCRVVLGTAPPRPARRRHRAPQPGVEGDSRDVASRSALDLGYGAGGDTVWLARHGSQVTAVDISSAAVERVRARSRQLGIDGRVTGTTWPGASPTGSST
ncbi:methyltransferase domain-containing protein [Micromonospora sp. WMMD956]|uniref:class I SAM-dependent methyltransferase n=1 Tax=Micromonospora TaxID=1873 RepID=UPI0024166CF9|nr:methyltransferase domain-containing protein [Micromonospora sp. WMMD956]MDG4819372.1 methyltransferase domain-containing protein [Micromonospora sp. WMMD956]